MACLLPPCDFGKVVPRRGLAGTEAFLFAKKMPKVKKSSKVNFSPKVVASPAYGGLGAGGVWPAACRQLETNAWARHGAGMLRLRLLAARAHRPSRAHAFVSSSKGTNQIKSNFRKWPLWGHYRSIFFFSVEPARISGDLSFRPGQDAGLLSGHFRTTLRPTYEKVGYDPLAGSEGCDFLIRGSQPWRGVATEKLT